MRTKTWFPQSKWALRIAVSIVNLHFYIRRYFYFFKYSPFPPFLLEERITNRNKWLNKWRKREGTKNAYSFHAISRIKFAICDELRANEVKFVCRTIHKCGIFMEERGKKRSRKIKMRVLTGRHSKIYWNKQPVHLYYAYSPQ